MSVLTSPPGQRIHDKMKYYIDFIQILNSKRVKKNKESQYIIYLNLAAKFLPSGLSKHLFVDYLMRKH